MKAILGRIICERGEFVEEFLTRDVLAPMGYAWTRERGAAFDFVTCYSARAAALRHAYNEPGGRLRVPLVIFPSPDFSTAVPATPTGRPATAGASAREPQVAQRCGGGNFSAQKKKLRGMRGLLQKMEEEHPHEQVFAAAEARCGA